MLSKLVTKAYDNKNFIIKTVKKTDENLVRRKLLRQFPNLRKTTK